MLLQFSYVLAMKNLAKFSPKTHGSPTKKLWILNFFYVLSFSYYLSFF